jgi:DNA-binding transcriptional LysR family regulator
MAFRLPPLSSLRVFEAAARHNSFRKAAEELNLTASAVSHGVQTLESWLGVELFHRETRGLRLTGAGEVYAPLVNQALTVLTEATDRLPGRKATGTLSVSAAPTFAHKILLPRLERFAMQFPDIRVRIDTSQRLVDLTLDDFDIAPAVPGATCRPARREPAVAGAAHPRPRHGGLGALVPHQRARGSAVDQRGAARRYHADGCRCRDPRLRRCAGTEALDRRRSRGRPSRPSVRRGFAERQRLLARHRADRLSEARGQAVQALDIVGVRPRARAQAGAVVGSRCAKASAQRYPKQAANPARMISKNSAAP